MRFVQPSPDRRANRRFPLPVSLQYRAANSPIAGAWKNGRALDMSAGGIRIQIPEIVSVGTRLELAMDWTGVYHDREKMRLHLTVSVVRVDRRGTALQILRSRFCEVRPMIRARRAESSLAVA